MVPIRALLARASSWRRATAAAIATTILCTGLVTATPALAHTGAPSAKWVPGGEMDGRYGTALLTDFRLVVDYCSTTTTFCYLDYDIACSGDGYLGFIARRVWGLDASGNRVSDTPIYEHAYDNMGFYCGTYTSHQNDMAQPRHAGYEFRIYTEYYGVLGGTAYTIDPPPDAPSDLALASVQHDAAELNWKDNATDETSQQVQRSDDGRSSWATVATLPADQTTYTDSGLTGGHTYWYRIRASNAGGDSAWSNELEVTPAFPEAASYGMSWLHGANPTGLQGDPVNSATGSFVTSVTDAALPGIRLPFSLARTYNSRDASSGSLGSGWTHNLAVSLRVGPDGDIAFRGEGGEEINYLRQLDGSYLAASGTWSKLASVPGGYELTRRDQIRYRFDDSGRLMEIVERGGKKLALAYNAGVLSSVTDTVGRRMSLSHDTQGLLTQLALPDGRTVSYGYRDGLLTNVTDVRGGLTAYSYDSSRRLTKIIDQNGNTIVDNRYEPDGRVVEQADARGKVTTFGWDAQTQTSVMTDARGHAWKDVYAGNVLQARVGPLGDKVTFDHDQDLNVTSLTDARGNSWTMGYDRRGNLLSRRAPSPLGHEETWTYTTNNDVATYRDGDGHMTTFNYDGAGLLTKVTEPGSVTTEFVRSPATGLVEKVIDPRLDHTTLGYDSTGNLVRVTTPKGHVTTYGYDAAGRLTSAVDPRGNEPGVTADDYTWRYGYDDANHVTKILSPLGAETTWAYDPAGNLRSTTDAKARSTTYDYTPSKLLTSVDPPGPVGPTSYTYDATGNVASRTDPKNHTTTYEYDAAGRMTATRLANSSTWRYGYDANGNVTTVEDAIGNATASAGDGITTYGYDAADRLTSIDYAGTTPDVTYGYDARSNRTQMNDGTGTTTYSYDARGRLEAVTKGASTTAYTYDPESHIKTITYPGGRAIAKTYDRDDNLDSVSSNGVATTYRYDAAGNQIESVLPASNGHRDTRSYDSAGRLTELRNIGRASTLSSFSYRYDAVGNPTEVVSLDGTTRYTYDDLDRLTKVCYPGGCGLVEADFISYSYDDVGNRVGEKRPTGTTTWTHDAADRVLTETGPTSSRTFDHDANGNMTKAGATSMAYDESDRMTSLARKSSTWNYAYDGDGVRARTSGSDDVEYTWDVNAPLPMLIEEKRAGAAARDYTYGNGLVSSTGGGESSYYHYDGIGSVTNVTDSQGLPQWSYSYDPFGNSRSATKVNPLAPDNPMRFAGEYQDPSGVYHLRARQYDPSVGRFTATDPVSPSMTDSYPSAYAYVNNQPTVYVDPSGQVPAAAPFVYYGGLTLWKIIAGGALAGAGIAGAGVALDHHARSYDFPESVEFLQSPILGEVPLCDGWAASGSSVMAAREIEEVGSEDELREVFDRERAGGIPRTDTDYPGELHELPDGTRVGWRDRSSNGRPAVDRHGPNGSKTWHIP